MSTFEYSNKKGGKNFSTIDEFKWDLVKALSYEVGIFVGKYNRNEIFTMDYMNSANSLILIIAYNL